MGQCLRGKMAEAGLAPPLPAADVAETAAVEEPPEQVAIVDEAVPEEPAMDVTPPAEVDAVAAGDVVAATFGLLRAEPDGSVVIAGSGAPGSEVEVFANGEKLGSTTVEQTGDWVLVPDAPLAPGGLEITLGEAGKPGQSDEAFIVVINEDKTTQPLVVASTPGQASEVLQGLDQPLQTADVAPEQATPAEADPAAVEPTGVETPEAATEAAPAEPAAEPVDATEPATAEASEPASAEPAVIPTEEPTAATAAADTLAVEEPAATDSQTAEPESAVVADTAEPVAEPAAPATAETMAPGSEPQAEVAAVAPTEPTEAQAAPDWAPPSIDAIEIEGERSFFAGAGPDGGVIRLYVDDNYVADATIEGGRWLVEGGNVLTKPNQRIRVDLLAPGSADVVARSEVDFVVDLPAADTPVQVADTPVVPEPDNAASPEAATEATPVEPAMPESAEPVAAPAEPATVPADTAPAEPAAPQPTEPGSAPAQTEVAPAVPAEPVAPVSSEPEPAAITPAAATEATPQPATQPSDAEPAVPTLVAVSVGDPDAERFASGKAIIRRGDNLWTIARRVYGEGIKYTTIYEANTGQIRDPDRIYPGQVFGLPEELASQ